MLTANLGKGYFSHDGFLPAPPVFTDASKSDRYCGGGWVSGDGDYLWYTYGTNSKRSPIDALEGDTVLSAVECNGHKWRRKIVTVRVDNRAFQLSAVKGWSRADRLNSLLKKIFFLCIKFECVLDFKWISTHDNILADALSRPGGEALFLRHPLLAELLSENGGVIRRHPACSTKRSIGGKGPYPEGSAQYTQ
jgi:hypothetical protein